MIFINNILKKSLIKSINYEFDLPIYGEETFEHNMENCFFVEVVNSSEKRLLHNCRERLVTFLIHYLPDSNNAEHEEFLDVADKLYEVLDIVGEEERFLASSLAHEIKDDKLLFSASYKFRLVLSDNVDLMENLEKNERILR